MARSIRLHTIKGLSARCPLSVIGEYADRPLDKRSISDLLQMAELPPEERAWQLHETMKVGLARCSMRLSSMPFGFCSSPTIKRVTAAYTQNFREVMEFEHERGVKGIATEDYQILMKKIFDQHRGTMIDVAKGVFEFYEDLNKLFGEVNLADVRQQLPIIQDIERSLDQFFTDRLTLRLLISHVQNLNKGEQKKDMVGVINVNTQPIQILCRAFLAMRFICLRDYNIAPELLVNLTAHEDFLAAEATASSKLPYVQAHLFYIFLELFKNAARASVERAKMDQGLEGEGDANGHLLNVPDINVTVPEPDMWDSQRVIKVFDHGTGMSRSALPKAFSYFYSSVASKPTVADEVSDFDQRVPLAGFGFGLPISRVMARYFQGNIKLNSIIEKGTDVYIYL